MKYDAGHGPDWSDWDMLHPEEGPSCECGYNGAPEDCAAARALDSTEQEPRCTCGVAFGEVEGPCVCDPQPTEQERS